MRALAKRSHALVSFSKRSQNTSAVTAGAAFGGGFGDASGPGDPGDPGDDPGAPGDPGDPGDGDAGGLL
jgi:hypothetical protein